MPPRVLASGPKPWGGGGGGQIRHFTFLLLYYNDPKHLNKMLPDITLSPHLLLVFIITEYNLSQSSSKGPKLR